MLEFPNEVRAFEAALPELLERHEGQFAVIHDSEVAATLFPSYDAALAWGYEQFGLQRFFVKQIGDKAHTTHFMRGFIE